MKKTLSPRKFLLISLLLLSLSLSACGSNPPDSTAPAKPSAEAACQAVLDSGAFSEELEALDTEVALGLYAACGLDADTVTGCFAWLSTGATAEECVFLTFDSEEAANAALTALENRVTEQIEALTDYQPQEIPKLEKPLYGVAPCAEGYWTFLVVANDRDLAESALNSLK